MAEPFCAAITIGNKGSKHQNCFQESILRLPAISDLTHLSDGVGLACVVALYLPADLGWRSIAFGDPPSMADSLHNIQLFQRVLASPASGQNSPAANVCHLTDEDIVYLHASIKQNVLAFLADLFVALELVRGVGGGRGLPGESLTVEESGLGAY